MSTAPKTPHKLTHDEDKDRQRSERIHACMIVAATLLLFGILCFLASFNATNAEFDYNYWLLR